MNTATRIINHIKNPFSKSAHFHQPHVSFSSSLSTSGISWSACHGSVSCPFSKVGLFAKQSRFLARSPLFHKVRRRPVFFLHRSRSLDAISSTFCPISDSNNVHGNSAEHSRRSCCGTVLHLWHLTASRMFQLPAQLGTTCHL